MADGDVKLASAVTPEWVTETRKDGSTYQKQILISMDTLMERGTSQSNTQNIQQKAPTSLEKGQKEKEPEMPRMNFEPDYEPVDMDHSPAPEQTRTYRVGFKLK